MKKYICFIGIASLMFSCGGGGDSDPIADNTAPTVPALVSPTNNKLCINNLVNFEWNPSTDAEKDLINYQIQIATDNQFTQIVKTVEGTTSYQTFTLNKGIAYYWRVKAIDSKKASSNYSDIYSFYTEANAVTNHAPFLPQPVLPEINSSVNSSSVTLKWLAADVDAADVLVYDVYFGTENQPTTKVGSNLTSTSLEVNSLQAATNYYWKVVVKDNKGGETIGAVWNFKTD